MVLTPAALTFFFGHASQMALSYKTRLAIEREGLSTVEDLSDIMAKQDSELRRLGLLVDHLAQRARARETDGGGGIILGDERPPHY